MNNKLGLLIWGLVMCTSLGMSQAVVHTNLDKNPWTICVLPSCNPGGQNVPISESATETSNSLKISITGDSANLLVYQNAGEVKTNNFYSDFQVLSTQASSTTTDTLEFDMFAYNAPTRFMFGSQCKFGGFWQIWDELDGKWVDTKLNCDLTFGVWHHIQWWVHRNGTIMYYDVLGVDNVYTQIGMSEPAGSLNPTWSNQSGINFQIDLLNLGKTISSTEFIKDVNFVEE